MWSLVFGPHVATLPNLHKTSPLEREIETSLLCYSGSRKGKSVYLVVGSPWWLSSLTCSISWPSFSHSSDMFPSASISKHVALSSQECHTFFFFLNLLEREWKQKWDMSGSAILSGVEGYCTCPSWLRKESCPQKFCGGEVLTPLMLPPFPLSHVPRNLARSYSTSVPLGHWRVTWLHWRGVDQHTGAFYKPLEKKMKLFHFGLLNIMEWFFFFLNRGNNYI